MSNKHRPPMSLREVTEAEDCTQPLTSPLDTAQIRLKLVTTCYRPDRSAEQIIAMAKDLETYVTAG